MKPSDLLGRTLGRFRIDAELGRGAMATVYKAWDVDLERPVAVKVMHAFYASSDEFLERFDREAKLAAKLEHPNVTHIYAVGNEDGLPWFAMSYIDGGDLREHLTEQGGRLPFQEAARILDGILAGVGYAHTKDIIHRDLKPANVMLTPEGKPVLMDFGIAKPLGNSKLTRTGASLGTLIYMSPEQFRAKSAEVGRPADLYACGVILYELLAGTPPFMAEDPIQVGFQHVHERPPDLSALAQDPPEGLLPVVYKALEKRPDDRYQTADEFREALSALAAGGTPDVQLTDFMSGATDSVPGIDTNPPRPTFASMPGQGGGLNARQLTVALAVGVLLIFAAWRGGSRPSGPVTPSPSATAAATAAATPTAGPTDAATVLPEASPPATQATPPATPAPATPAPQASQAPPSPPAATSEPTAALAPTPATQPPTASPGVADPATTAPTTTPTAAPDPTPSPTPAATPAPSRAPSPTPEAPTRLPAPGLGRDPWEQATQLVSSDPGAATRAYLEAIAGAEAAELPALLAARTEALLSLPAEHRAPLAGAIASAASTADAEHRPSHAVQLYRLAVQLDSEQRQLRYRVADAYHSMTGAVAREKGGEAFLEAVEQDSAWLLGRHLEDHLDSLQASSGKWQWRIHRAVLAHADTLLEAAGEHDRAGALLDQVLEFPGSHHGLAYARLAEVRRRRGDTKGAAWAARKALEVDVGWKKKLTTSTLDAFERRLEREARTDPLARLTQTRLRRARQQFNDHDFREAIDELKKVFRQYPDQRDTLSRYFAEAGVRVLAEGRRDLVHPLLKGALDLDASNPLAHKAFGDFSLDVRKDFDKALFHYRKALSIGGLAP